MIEWFREYFIGNASFLVAQILGLIALMIAFCSFQAKVQRNIVLCQFVSSIFFTAHYFMLGAYVGCLLNALGAFRALIFSQKKTSWGKSPFWPWLFAGVFLIAGICTLDGDLNLTTWAVDFSNPITFVDLFPIIGMEFTTIAFWSDDAAKVRIYSLPSSPFWLTYNAVHASLGGVLTETIVTSSIILGIVRHDLPSRRKGTR